MISVAIYKSTHTHILCRARTMYDVRRRTTDIVLFDNQGRFARVLLQNFYKARLAIPRL